MSNGEFWWLENNIEQETSAAGELSKESFEVFPNPFSENISISNLAHDSYRMQITNAAGSVVYSPATASGVHDLSALSPGTYFLSLVNMKTQEVSGTVIVKGE